jgi:hypothetical protein
MKYWEIIADKLKKAGWSYGYVSAIDSQGRTIWIVDAHRGDGRRFIVRVKLISAAAQTSARAGRRLRLQKVSVSSDRRQRFNHKAP